MPIIPPAVDGRRYQDLLDEAIARIPVHNPEWTNFNRSDPGITLVELFAFLTENLLYRADRIPERNHRTFLSLLGVPLRSAASARGVVTVANERGPLETVTVTAGLEVRAGEVPFLAELGLDVLPVEGRVFVKRKVDERPELTELYEQLYASFRIAGGPERAPDLQPYETVRLDGSDPAGVDLVTDTVDRTLWVALLARDRDTPDAVRKALVGRTLSLGVVPVADESGVRLPGAAGTGHLEFTLPAVPVDGLPDDPDLRVATYAVRPARADVDVLSTPGIVQVPLPGATVVDGRETLSTWTGLEPLEEGVGAFPPVVGPELDDRLVTWLRIEATSSAQARILWAGINATTVTQRATVSGELLPRGTGAPDQTARLSRTPVLPGSVRLTVAGVAWQETADLFAAGPEVPVPDLRLPPGAAPARSGPVEVYAVDAEAGVVRFGDGLRGKRPPSEAEMRADYDYGLGGAGNLGPSAITAAPALPSGFTVTNPVRTWGGVDAETAADGERRIPQHLRHRDRLVTAEDFEAITRATPGVDIARVDVLAAFDPQLTPNLPGGAPGAVTLMIVPRYDPLQPEAPHPDRFVLDAVCAHLDPRRLVTTELILRGPNYVPIRVSVGVEVTAGTSFAEVQRRVEAELRRVLSPLPLDAQHAPPSTAPTYVHAATGWPLRTPVTVAELTAFVTRVDGVRVVNELLIDVADDHDTVAMAGLMLPHLAAVAVGLGDPMPFGRLGGAPVAVPPGIPVPVLPEGC